MLAHDDIISEGPYSYSDIFHIKIHLLVQIIYVDRKKWEAREIPIHIKGETFYITNDTKKTSYMELS